MYKVIAESIAKPKTFHYCHFGLNGLEWSLILDISRDFRIIHKVQRLESLTLAVL